MLAVLLVMSLASCDETVRQPEYPLEFSKEISVTYNNTEFLYEAVYFCGNLQLSVLEPEALNGLVINLNSDATEVSMDSLELKYDTGTKELLRPFNSFFDLLENLNSTKPEFKKYGDLLCAELLSDGQNCKVYLDKSNCEFVKISLGKYTYIFDNK